MVMRTSTLPLSCVLLGALLCSCNTLSVFPSNARNIYDITIVLLFCQVCQAKNPVEVLVERVGPSPTPIGVLKNMRTAEKILEHMQ